MCQSHNKTIADYLMCNSVRDCYTTIFTALVFLPLQWLSGWWYETDVCSANTYMVVQDDTMSGWCSGAPVLYRFSANQRVVAIIKWNVFVFVIVFLFWRWRLSVCLCLCYVMSRGPGPGPGTGTVHVGQLGLLVLSFVFSHSFPMPYHTIPRSKHFYLESQGHWSATTGDHFDVHSFACCPQLGVRRHDLRFTRRSALWPGNFVPCFSTAVSFCFQHKPT